MFDFDEFTVPVVAVLILGFAVGIVLIIVGVSLIKKMNRLKLSCTALTIGKVTDIEKTVETMAVADGSGVQKVNRRYPVFEYSADGRTINYRSILDDGKSKFKVGQEVTVFYNPQDVEQHYVQEEKIGNKSGIIVVIGGVIFIAVVIFTFFGVGYGFLELAEWDDFWP